MKTSSNAELMTLFKHVGLTLTKEELDLVSPVFEGFKQQLQGLHTLDLEGEEVQGGFGPQPGAR